jgi:hypothetical protein
VSNLLEKTDSAFCGLNNTEKKSGNQVVNRFNNDTAIIQKEKAGAVFDLCLNISYRRTIDILKINMKN